MERAFESAWASIEVNHVPGGELDTTLTHSARPICVAIDVKPQRLRADFPKGSAERPPTLTPVLHV
jgi:hypothetical protein